LSFGKDKRLEFALKVSDCKFDARLAWIESDLKLRSLSDVANADNIPSRLGRFFRAEGADEGKLLG